MLALILDPGKTSGFLLADNGRDEGHGFAVVDSAEIKKCTPYKLFNFINEVLSDYEPKVIIHGMPVRYYNVVAAHSKLIGVLEIFGEDLGIPVISAQDKNCKKEVLGKGTAKKDQIMSHYGLESEHIADCHMFAEWFFKHQS